MFTRVIAVVAAMVCSCAQAQQSIERSLDSIAQSLRFAEIESARNNAIPQVSQDIQYREIAINLQQQLIAVSRNANLAVVGWRESEAAKATLLAKQQQLVTKQQQLEAEVNKLRRELLDQRKLVNENKVQQAYAPAIVECLRNRNANGIKNILKYAWSNSGEVAQVPEVNLQFTESPKPLPIKDQD